MKKNASIAVAALLAASMMLGACGGKAPETKAPETNAPASESKAEETKAEASDEKVTITFWDENAGDGRSEIYAELIDRFEAENPNIHIEYLGLTQTEASSKYQTAIQAGETPDVGGAIDDWVAAIIQQDVCVPLDDYFKAAGFEEVVNPGMVDIARDFHPDGQLYYIPKTANLNGFWINNDMFAEKSLEAPATWDEVFDDIEALTDIDNGIYGFVIRGGGSSASELMTLMYSYSGQPVMFEDGKVTVNTPENLEFVEKFQSIYGVYTAESDITAGYKELVAAFDSGSAAMIYHNLGSYNTHMEAFGSNEHYQFVPYAPGKNGNFTFDGSSTTGYVMFNSCEHPDEAWAWIEYLIGHDGNSYWNEKVGQIPINSTCLEDAWLEDAPHIKTALAAMSADNAVAIQKPEFLPGYASIMSATMEPAVQDMLAGDITPQEWLEMLEEELQNEYDAYMAQ